jgi:nucleotide-binding universal stress UspA family protein
MSGLYSGFIVVGVDGTPESSAALRWALARAAGSQQGLRIVHCRPAPCGDSSADGTAGAAPAGEVDALSMLQDELAVARSLVPQPPEISVTQAVGSAESVLVRQSHRAALLVLGASLPSVSTDPLHGPVAGPCLRQVGCPVVVVGRDGGVTVAPPLYPALAGAEG